MSIENGLTEQKKFSAKDQNPPTGSKTQRVTETGNIGSKRGGATKK